MHPKIAFSREKPMSIDEFRGQAARLIDMARTLESDLATQKIATWLYITHKRGVHNGLQRVQAMVEQQLAASNAEAATFKPERKHVD